MYSLLLMTALAGTPDATGFGWRSGGGCYGSCTGYSSCYGCTGYSSCNGCCGGYVTSYGCCGGYSCSGCSGYSRGGFLGCGILARLCGRMSSCHGCSGCYGSSCYGSSCYGSCSGGGCYGSCYGSGLNSGCWGSCYGSGAGYGCGGGCIGSYPAMGGVVVPAPAIPPANITPAPVPAPAPEPAKGTTSSTADETAPARLTVELPANATLYVDGTATTLHGAVRQFHTPALPTGQAFFYELKAEVTIAGKTQVEQKRVVVRAGETITAEFPRLLTLSQTGAATVAVSK